MDKKRSLLQGIHVQIRKVQVKKCLMVKMCLPMNNQDVNLNKYEEVSASKDVNVKKASVKKKPVNPGARVTTPSERINKLQLPNAFISKFGNGMSEDRPFELH
ncbi:hypothetical protein LXL04_034716 [Taraxacum kok-saghyz]